VKAKSRRPVNKNNALSQNVKNAVKAAPTEEIVLQFAEGEVAVADISEKVRMNYKENGGAAEIKDVKIYVKPQDNKAYYVVNGEKEGSVDLV